VAPAGVPAAQITSTPRIDVGRRIDHSFVDHLLVQAGMDRGFKAMLFAFDWRAACRRAAEALST
jgi:hypothetical protein